MKTLDITDWKQQGTDLKQEILNAVKDTQSTLIQEYPHELVMRLDQFNGLKSDPDMQAMYQDSGHIYHTAYNVMEVIVKDDSLPEKREHDILLT